LLDSPLIHLLLFGPDRMDDVSKRCCWVGFDLGGTKMMAAIFNGEFRLLGRKRRKTKGNEGAKAGLERIIQTIRDALADAGRSEEELAGIGIGCPATMLNDVDAGLYGEYRFGAAKGSRCAVGVFPGTGIGGGCVYDGQILRGRNLSCFEIGHMQVTQHGLPCGCGRNGCLETEASRLAISAAAAAAAFRGEAPHLLAVAGTALSDIRSGVLADAIRAGDVVIEKIVRRAAMFIGDAVGNIVNLLAPDVVVLGGGLVEAMPDLMVKGIEDAARKRAAPAFSKSFKVAAARLGDDAVAKGAAAWIQKNVSVPATPTV
jgi:glucokinase